MTVPSAQADSSSSSSTTSASGTASGIYTINSAGTFRGGKPDPKMTMNGAFAPSAGPSPCPRPIPGQPATGTCAWYDPTDPDPMHKQNITYDKANENLALLLTYTENKLSALRGDIKSGDSARMSNAKGIMGQFCNDSDPTTPEPADKCFDRYERYTLLQIARIRAAIIYNDTANAHLMSKQVNRDTRAVTGDDRPTVELAGPDGNPLPTRKPTVSSFTSLKELQEAYDKQSTVMRASITNQFAQWLEDPDQYARLPDKADFPKFKKILRDPNNPAAGYFTVAETNPDGSVKTDEAAYKAALEAYKYRNPKGNALADDANSMLLDKFGTTKPGPNPKKNLSSTLAPGKFGDVAKDGEKAVFSQVRRKLVNAINDEVKGIMHPARSPSSGGSSKSVSVGGSGSGKPSPADSSPEPANGNEQVVQPTGNLQNQHDTFTVRLPLDTYNKKTLELIQTDVGDGKQPAVELPPPADE